MSRPLVSVIIETVTARADCHDAALTDVLAGPIAALERQSWPKDRLELILVLDEGVSAHDQAEVARRFPRARIVTSSATNYFAAKNAGAAAAAGEFVLFLDADCTPDPDWIERLIGRFEPGVAAVAGRVRYAGDSWAARTFSVPDFGYIHAQRGGDASGINLGCVAVRRDVIAAHPLEEGIARNGACYLLFHRLRQGGLRIVYANDAVVLHRLDFRGIGFLAKHFDRGYDNVAVLRADSSGSLRGTRWYRRFGGLALIGFSARRILIDWARLARHRRQIGVSLLAIPYFALVGAGLRAIELAGALSAQLRTSDR